MKNMVGFVNGKIYVSFKPLKVREALLIFDGKVMYAGKKKIVEEVCRLMGSPIVDLEGKVVLPGFIDSHMHLDELGMYLNMIDLRGVKSIRELQEKVRRYASTSENFWILGHGWDHEIFSERRWPTRWDLDEVVKDRPVMLTRVCLHAAVLNTRAMELTGILNLNLPGVIRDENGDATGIVKEEALEIVREKFRETLTPTEYGKFLKDAMEYAASQGVTTVGFVSCDERSLKELIRLEKKIRIRIYLNPGRKKLGEGGMYSTMDLLEALKKLGIRKAFGNEWLKILGIKILADGSLGARTAWLSEPYSDDPSTVGAPNIDKNLLEDIVRESHTLGLQMAVHGIGDRTIDMILDVYARLKDAKASRHRIEHVSVIREDQIERMAELGVVASVQPHFIITDWWTEKRLGENRKRWIYPFRSMMEKSIIIGLGTDSPVEPLNPWETVYAAVTRGKYEKSNICEESQNLTLEEALHAYTLGSAYIMFEENTLGTLEIGKLADFIIVDRDPFHVDEKDLKEIKVLATYIGGKKVY